MRVWGGYSVYFNTNRSHGAVLPARLFTLSGKRLMWWVCSDLAHPRACGMHFSLLCVNASSPYPCLHHLPRRNFAEEEDGGCGGGRVPHGPTSALV